MKNHKKTFEFDYYSKKSNSLKLFLLTFLILITVMLAVLNINTYIRNQNVVYKTSQEFIKNLNQINYLQVHYRENKGNEEEVRKILPEFDIYISKAMDNLRTFEKLLENTITYYPVELD